MVGSRYLLESRSQVIERVAQRHDIVRKAPSVTSVVGGTRKRSIMVKYVAGVVESGAVLGMTG